MQRLTTVLALLASFCVTTSAHTSMPVYADGDIAPMGAPNGRIDAGDLLLATRFSTGQLAAGNLELAHGDLYPPHAPDGVINIQDLVLLQQRVLAADAESFVENLDLFNDGPATVMVDVGGTFSYTTLVPGGYTGPNASVINDAGFTDPENASNTVWRFSASGGVANLFLGTGDLGADPVLDTGFDLSGDGSGRLVFDLKVVSLSAGANLTVKIDSGYPNLGQLTLMPSQYSVGSWRRVSISFAELLANPGPGGATLDLNNVVNALVVEVSGGDAEFYLDNIFINRSCPQAEGCNASVKTKASYSLVWSDEFDGTELDPSNWAYEYGYGSNGWGNNEWQQYTDDPSNLSVGGGNLVISAQCPSPPCGVRDGSITSARITTLNKFSFKFGKVEARIKVPVGDGAWPAFWMLGRNFPFVGWPFSGEVDIMEAHNAFSNQYTTHFTMHWCDDVIQASSGSSDCFPSNEGWTYVSDNLFLFPQSLGDDFHVFSAEWSEDEIIGKIDGTRYFSLPINPATMGEFLEEFFLILNVGMGGTLGSNNAPPDGGEVWPQTMMVDYVRVYQEDGGNGTYTIGAPPPSPELGIYTESHTQTLLPYSITNGADFGGNVLNINQNSTNVIPLDGSFALEVVFNNTGKSFGGFLFNFGLGQDISAYQTLKFSVDASAMSQMQNVTIELENPGQQKFPIQLANYTPTVSGNWATYEVPLAHFGALDLGNVNYLGIWNPRTTGGSLVFGTLYFDDIHFAGGG